VLFLQELLQSSVRVCPNLSVGKTLPISRIKIPTAGALAAVETEGKLQCRCRAAGGFDARRLPAGRPFSTFTCVDDGSWQWVSASTAPAGGRLQ
jgi:hypothetical protein